MVTAVVWRPSYRIIASRYPFVGVYDRIADATLLEDAIALEALTNDRILDEVGTLNLVRPEDRVAGPGTTPIMAAFTHTRPSRFSDGAFGVYYAALRRETAIAEMRHHQTLFLRETAQESIDLDMRLYAADVTANCEDLRTADAADPRYSRTSYADSQAFARDVRTGGADGIVYRSVRDDSGTGECAAVFRPRCISNCATAAYLGFRWDGHRIAEVYVRAEILRFEN